VVLFFSSRDDWDTWLANEHERSDGVWLKIPKKGAGLESVSYAEALDVALAYGWIDAQKRGLDDDHWLQRFTPRTARSKWSKINREKVTEMIERGAMKPAGLREVQRAKADGRWEAAYDAQSTATVPDDLHQALEAQPAAMERFAALDRRNRYAILHRVQDAKKPETRERRIQKYVAMLAAGGKIYE
jgi:uncharacterized protein YdeI (YjbR/CyaY-like superfamily)